METIKNVTVFQNILCPDTDPKKDLITLFWWPFHFSSRKRKLQEEMLPEYK